MSLNKPVVCIVDAFSTGAELPSEFSKYGYDSIHIQSSADVDSELRSTFRETDFIKHWIYEEVKENDILLEIRRYNPSFVIAGTETGVILADKLAHVLDLPGNDPRTSSLRRNKYDMNEAIREKGLPSVRQARCATVTEALEAAKKMGGWPIVAKPLDSAGTDHVYFCRSENELTAACERILMQVNRMGSLNEYVLVQECLEGQQYFINAVSLEGKHIFTEIWKDTKKSVEGAGMICDQEELLPYEGNVQEQIMNYMKQVLDVLGIRDGASHSELMFTERGPVLIESAARMQGTILHEALIAAIGDSHVTTTVERYVDPDKFMSRMQTPYTLRKYLFCITLSSHVSGVVVENRVEALTSALPSFFAVFHTPQAGEKIERTVDLFTNPGILYLLHQNRDQIIEDYNQIRQWEREQAFFEVDRILSAER
ncbi:ATP-grasp domain-containing protein [Xylanibacillus composti]|uniref:ATP-grasp domain-containing protein n=1 Tax=Xylanibacillus composti TaxID=1572762 RepID=A0A8J4H321_9BACL|nr:ATP-grasp domain-containing protein [Xylanibacillus composti]